MAQVKAEFPVFRPLFDNSGRKTVFSETCHEKWCRRPAPRNRGRGRFYAARLFLSNASSTSLSTLASPPGSSGSGARS